MTTTPRSDPGDAGQADLANQVLDLVARETGHTARLEDRLNDLGMDSLELAGFIGVIEKAFDIRVDSEIMDVDTFGELVRYVESRR